VQAALARQQPLYKTYKPATPGLRHLRRPLTEHLWGGKPVRHLTVARRRHGGCNHHGRITVRFVGGGHRQRIRIIDYSRATPGPHDVVRIEYDPGRSAHIALIKSQDPAATATKKWTYILACEGMRAGDVVQSFRHGIPDNMIPGYVDSRGSARSKKAGAASGTESTLEMSAQEAEIEAAAERARASARSLAVGVLRSMTIKPGNVLPLRLIPSGTVIHNVALHPGGPGRLVRAAGTFAQVMLNEEGDRYAHVRLQSGEVRKVLKDCVASIGKVSNPLWKNRSLGKAGRSRWLGRRPHVRGMAMNA
jgi:ribosomal protein L2